MTSDVILETEGLTKEFRGFVAVRNVGLRVRRGSIRLKRCGGNES